jgi:DedD protein
MDDRSYPEHEDRGLSARQLVMLFLGIVTVCAVFFAAGFLVGYNERTSKELPAAERVTPSSVIPPTVNPPLKSEPVERPSAAENAKPIEPTPLRAAKPAAAPPAPAKRAPEPAPREERKAAETGGNYVLQVAASSSRSDAEEVARGLKGRGFPAFVVTPQQSGGNDRLYRVQIGPYATREAAEQVKPRLELAGFKAPFIKH